MADSSGRGSGMTSAGGPSTPSGPKPKGRRTQGGKVVESRYLQYEKKTTKKAPATDALKTSGKIPEGGRKPNSLQKSKESSGIFGKGDLQSTLLDGHGTAPPYLDLSAINDKSMLRKTPQLEKTMSKKTESTSFSASQEKDSMEMLSPYEAVSECFKEQYKTFAAALDTTRHELPVRSIHLDGDAQQFLDDLQRELMTTRRLLGELGVCSSEENGKALDLLGELKEVTQKKDLELRRSFAQVLELSAGVSKEAALINQEVWEEAQGPMAPHRWYFIEEGTQRESRGEAGSLLLSGADRPCAL
ncbi:HAUS augmin-like complex subunit 8 isoform 2-T2 [Molossus nigricans]